MSVAPTEAWPRFTVVRGGVDTEVWRRREPRPSGERIEILNVGRLAPVKGPALLIEAVARLREQGVDARCRIVGEGPERAALERRIAALALGEAVELTGAVGQDRIQELYEQSDIFCLPSFREGLPFVVIEALAMEIAVVATRIMGIPELITHGQCGVLVSPGRVDQLTDALADLAADPDRRRRMATAGRSVVQRDYSLSRLASEMAELFASARPPARP
jgi:glycosyltransferase involved in cell wall biosynthesis